LLGRKLSTKFLRAETGLLHDDDACRLNHLSVRYLFLSVTLYDNGTCIVNVCVGQYYKLNMEYLPEGPDVTSRLKVSDLVKGVTDNVCLK